MTMTVDGLMSAVKAMERLNRYQTHVSPIDYARLEKQVGRETLEANNVRRSYAVPAGEAYKIDTKQVRDTLRFPSPAVPPRWWQKPILDPSV